MIAVINSGAGNIASVERAILAAGGEDVRRVTTAAEVAQAQRIAFPGQGAFRPVMEWLRATGIAAELVASIARGVPYLGICLGMQVLFEDSDEGGSVTPGLAVLAGQVRRLPAKKLPHVGWNRVVSMGRLPEFSRESVRVEDVGFMYFVHSYGVQPRTPDRVGALATWYGGRVFLAGLRWGRHLVTQFHPEKSGKAGATMIGEWLRS
jgi:glutamine amidotransferase